MTTAGSALAASSSLTKPIAVLDIKLDTRVDAVDAGDKVHGTLAVFEEHATPLNSDKTLDLAQIRHTRASVTAIDIQLKVRGAFSLTNPKKQYIQPTSTCSVSST